MSSLVSTLAIAGLLTSTALVAPAMSSSLWTWSYSGGGITATGTFTTVDSPDTNGGYLITGITGSRNGQMITGLQPTGTWIPGNEPYAVDNRVYKGPGPQLTKNGFGFSMSDGTYSNPLYADFLPSPGYLEFYSVPASGSSSEFPVVFAADLVPTPESSKPALLLAGLTTFGLCHFTRFAFAKRVGRLK